MEISRFSTKRTRNRARPTKVPINPELGCIILPRREHAKIQLIVRYLWAAENGTTKGILSSWVNCEGGEWGATTWGIIVQGEISGVENSPS